MSCAATCNCPEPSLAQRARTYASLAVLLMTESTANDIQVAGILHTIYTRGCVSEMTALLGCRFKHIYEGEITLCSMAVQCNAIMSLHLFIQMKHVCGDALLTAGALGRDDFSLLHYAVNTVNVDATILLLQEGHPVNRCTAQGGLTPLHLVADREHPLNRIIIFKLLAYGADVEATTSVSSLCIFSLKCALFHDCMIKKICVWINSYHAGCSI